MFDSLRVQPALREQQGFKIRYAWYFITANVGIAIVYGYGVLGILFAKVPQEFQWILGLLTPFAKDISSKLLFKVACKSNSTEEERRSIKFPIAHYITTKHAVFLAVIVGNVSTPLTTYCILFLDFAKTIRATVKIIRRKRKGENVEGEYEILCFTLITLKYRSIANSILIFRCNQSTCLK